MQRARRRAGLTVLVATIAALATVSACSPSTPDPGSVNVAQLIGQTPDDAHNELEDRLDAEMTTDIWDFSPVGRRMNRYEDVIVAADKKVVTGDRPNVQFWALPSAELKWFDKHRKMPKIKMGAGCDAQHGSKVLEDVQDLVFIAAKPGAKRSSMSEKIEGSYDFVTDQKTWPNSWAKDQRASVGALWTAWSSGVEDMVVEGQRPKAGSTLRAGQLMVVFCSSSNVESGPADDDSVPIPPIPNNNDDNFDFPDRLCPTRFC